MNALNDCSRLGLTAAARRYSRRAAAVVGGRPRPARAFSLVELLAVALILSILAAIAAPRYAASLSDYRSGAAARRLAADLALARNIARAQSVTVTFDFSTTGAAYTVTGIPADAGGPFSVDLSVPPYNVDSLAITFTADSALSFNGYGTPSVGAIFEVRAAHSRRVVTLDADAGFAAVNR
jgi:prepilin-type N-terminal cleavage/methylation domain-containing protein